MLSYGVLQDTMARQVIGEILADPGHRKSIGELLAACRREAEEILRRNEPAVRALAEKLLEKEEVPGEEVEEIMQAKAVARSTPSFKPVLELVGENWHTPALLEASQRDGPPRHPLPPQQPPPPTGTGGSGRADAATAGGEFEW
jgi:hypothetical protein